MELWGRITNISGNQVTLSTESLEEVTGLIRAIKSGGDNEAIIQIADGRHLSSVQRKKIYAILSDFAMYTGDVPSDMKEMMKMRFSAESGHDHFSLATTDMTTAREFITFLLDFAIQWHIPLSKSGLELQDDLDAYMYQSLKYRSCVLCGRHADVHHIDTVGMGNDRKLVDHRNKHLIALCREHHQLAHNMGWLSFKETYHVKGILLKSETLIDLGIMTKKRMDEIDEQNSFSGPVGS